MAETAVRPSPQTAPFQRRDSSRQNSRNPVSDDPPSEAVMAECAPFPIYDADGEKHRFDSLYTGTNRRDLVIFVRHFFCGMCQDFLRSLNATLSPSDLAALPVPTTLTIIGCGDPSLLKDYAANSKCAFPIYADPSRELYDKLGMTSTLNSGAQPSYQTSSFVSVVTKSFAQLVGSGSGALKGGSFSQVGGDFVFEDGKPAWCHRMRNTRDHTEIPQLKKLISL